MLIALCDDTNTFIIAVQEHWLTDNNLNMLNNIHPIFPVMGFLLCEIDVMKRSAIWEVGFLWRKTFAICINIPQNDDDGRCLVLVLELNNHKTGLISVYVPCFVPDVNYSVELGHCMGFIEDVFCDGNVIIIVGDMNFEYSLRNSRFIQCSDVLNNNQISHCDDS